MTPAAAGRTPRHGAGAKIVLTLTLAMLGGVGISQGVLHGILIGLGAWAESVWLVAWGVALLASAASVKRTIATDADRPVSTRHRVRVFVGSQASPPRTSPFSA